VTLYDAQGPQADGSSDQSFLRAMPQLARLGEVERDQRLKALAWQQMRKDPARVLRLAAVKLGRTWSLVPNVSTYSGGATGLLSASYTLVVLVLAGLGLWRGWRRGRVAGSARGVHAERAYQVLLWLPVVYFTLLHCVYIGSLRYRVPLMPLLALAAASAFVLPAGVATTRAAHEPGAAP
jgi:hypothetical protein